MGIGRCVAKWRLLGYFGCCFCIFCFKLFCMNILGGSDGFVEVHVCDVSEQKSLNII